MPAKKKTNKTLAKIAESVEMVEASPEVRSSQLARLLADDEQMDNLVARAQNGASIGTLAGVLGIPDFVFRKWVYRGRAEWEKYDPDFAKTPYMELWEQLSAAFSDARFLAEAAFQKQNPERYLQSKTAALLGDDWREHVDDSKSKEEKTQLDIGQHFLESLKLLRLSGCDLNEIVDQDKLSLKTEAPKPKEEDVLLANGLIEPKPKTYLPGDLQDAVNTMHESLNVD